MHYGSYGFAKDPYVPTISTRDKFHQYTIGQRQGPSFLDYAAVKLYLAIALMIITMWLIISLNRKFEIIKIELLKFIENGCFKKKLYSNTLTTDTIFFTKKKN